MIATNLKLSERLLRIANRLVSTPVMADFAYGRFGRLMTGGVRRFQMILARMRRVPIERFRRSYFYPRKGLQLAVTNVCNARCTFCAYRLTADAGVPRGMMKMEIFKKALDEFAAGGGKFIDLTPTVGDPLLDSTLVEKIKYAKERVISDICLTTNAIAMCKRDMHKQIIDAGANIIAISLPSLEPESYKLVYGVDRYPEVVRGISALLRYNRERGEPARVILRFRNPQKPSAVIRSKDFIENVQPYLSEKVTCNFTADFDNWGGSINAQDMHGVMKLRKTPPRYKVPCVNLFNFTVRYDGTVRLCGCRLKETEDDGLVVGNIMKNSFEEIGRSEKVHQIIEGFYKGERPSTCQECSLYIPLSDKRMKSFENNGH